MNVFIVGAAKAGTTSLFYYLEQHPQVLVPIIKEPNYYSHINANEDNVLAEGKGPGDNATVWTFKEEEYRSLFPNSKKLERESYRYLDASVTNLYSSTAAKGIRESENNAKIIILLRNPIQRAWSHYKHLVRDGRESYSFEDALKLEQDRINKHWEFSWHYKNMGLYHEQIQRYFQHFEKEQIKVILFSDLINETKTVLEEVNHFLNLTPYDYKIETSHNASGSSRSRQLSYLVNQIAGYKKTINKYLPSKLTHKGMQLFRKLNTKQSELKMHKATKNKLQDYFHDSILETGKMINRDLTDWT